MLQAARVDTNQEKELTKYLRDHLGDAFCPTRAKIDMLSEGYAPIVSKLRYTGIRIIQKKKLLSLANMIWSSR